MTGFDAGWLGLREPHDHRARSAALARRFAAALPASPRLIDLAAGTGSNARYVQGAGRIDPDWLLVDSDTALLGAARDRTVVRKRALDLARDFGALDLTAVDGVTAAAFCDLVSAAWLEAFAARVARFRLPVLIALTVDGRLDLHPGDPADPAVLGWFRRHQRRDKGFGPALGGAAPHRLGAALRRHGYRVETRRSDWRLAGPDAPVLRPFIDGMVTAAAAVAPAGYAVVEAWWLRRLRQIDAGVLRVRVGQIDCFAAMTARK
ncbi:MAG: class I SAM-dependent methyltransferase [Alphaproteobacteria bacterium]|nr:class I SAM-dependent methyltransferase [Alphaproteobacteria bacterium]